ncbi:hypothetical protein Pfo_006727, partial [Paulownia fortunei]
MIGEIQATEASTLVTKNNSQPQFGPQFNKKGEKVWCDHCYKPRHTRETCWEIHGKPPNWKPRSYNRGNKAYQTGIDEQNDRNSIGVTSKTALFGKEQLNHLYKLLQFTQVSNNVNASCSLVQKGN